MNRIPSPLVLMALALASACAHAPAQTGLAEQEAEQVELGVSRIPRMVDPDRPDTAQPVTIITREEIDRTGAVSVEDALLRSRAGVFFLGTR